MAIQKTTPEHKERLNQVLAYIQENLDGSLSLETLSKVACFSPFHFHRLFAAYVGEPVNSYIRRVRLEMAAFKLAQSEESVTSIALSVGYETAAAFSKAFKQYFGKNPTEFKRMPTIPQMLESIRRNWEENVERFQLSNIQLPQMPQMPQMPSLPQLPQLPKLPTLSQVRVRLD